MNIQGEMQFILKNFQLNFGIVTAGSPMSAVGHEDNRGRLWNCRGELIIAQKRVRHEPGTFQN